MKAMQKRLAIVAAVTLLGACAGTPVDLGTRVSGPVPTGAERAITAEACGFQLFLFIPIKINDRMERAYGSLATQAGGDFIADVQVQESWGWRFVGTSYCTALRAKAVRPSVATVSPPPSSPAVGKYSYDVERLAKQASCHTTPKPILQAQGAGFETYSVACTSGEMMMFRCEFGNCRALK